MTVQFPKGVVLAILQLLRDLRVVVLCVVLTLSHQSLITVIEFFFDEVLLKLIHRLTHLQNFEMLLAIRNWQFLHQLATTLGPGG